MKKLSKILAVTCVATLILTACSTALCPLNNTVYSTYGFYASLNGTENQVSVQDTMTIKAAGTDSILINRMLGAQSVELPLSFTAKEDTLIFEFINAAQQLRTDTIWVAKDNLPHYESPECPAAMFHYVTGVRSTHVLIDSVYVVNPNINYNASENFKIYFRTAN